MRMHVQQTDSTNRIAREKVDAGMLPGTVIWADTQIAGKGQYGRSFSSPVGGLYFSLILQPDVPIASLSLVTLAAGLACRDVLSTRCRIETMIKWPNDVYFGDKKIGGILCENIFAAAANPPVSTVIIGVGINVNSTLKDFPADVQPLVTTIYEQTHELIDLEWLLGLLIASIRQMVEALRDDKDSLLDRWRAYDYLLNKPVRYTNGSEIVCGSGQGITTSGTYKFIDDQGGEREIIGGQLRPCHGAG